MAARASSQRFCLWVVVPNLARASWGRGLIDLGKKYCCLKTVAEVPRGTGIYGAPLKQRKHLPSYRELGRRLPKDYDDLFPRRIFGEEASFVDPTTNEFKILPRPYVEQPGVEHLYSVFAMSSDHGSEDYKVIVIVMVSEIDEEDEEAYPIDTSHDIALCSLKDNSWKIIPFLRKGYELGGICFNGIYYTYQVERSYVLWLIPLYGSFVQLKEQEQEQKQKQAHEEEEVVEEKVIEEEEGSGEVPLVHA
ncbi:hypothetical protein OROGR_009372 [Orobanche gracilis]